MQLRLTDQISMPMIGFGTYLIPDDAAPAAVRCAIQTGYRHIDTAEVYRNERGVGQAIHAAIAAGELTRDELFVTTKLWPGNAEWGQVPRDYDTTIAAFNDSLDRLGLDAVDLYLIHAPFPKAERLAQWRALVDLKQMGRTRTIGVSNYSEAHIEEIRAAGLPLPDANQIELHPWSQKPALVKYLQDNDIAIIAYSSLVPMATWRAVEGQGSAKTDAQRAEGQQDTPFKQMAAKYGVSEAQVLLRWGLQMGYAVLPKSVSEDRIRQNFDLLSFEIDAEDMAAMAAMDRDAALAWGSGDPLYVD